MYKTSKIESVICVVGMCKCVGVKLQCVAILSVSKPGVKERGMNVNKLILIFFPHRKTRGSGYLGHK